MRSNTKSIGYATSVAPHPRPAPAAKERTERSWFSPESLAMIGPDTIEVIGYRPKRSGLFRFLRLSR
jgi:hypothetical protein